MRRLAAGLLAAALAAAGCGGSGGGDGDGAKPSGARAIVDAEGEAPLVNSLEVEPGTGTLLVTTNLGFFRVDPAGGKDPAPVRGTVTARGRSAPVGSFLEILPVGPKALLGSGHPDRGGALPEFIGVMRSEDGGRTWSVISRLGEADLHRMVVKHDRLFAFDAVLGVVLVSEDGGRTFREKVTPQETMVELEVDPADPRRLLLASEQTTFRSDDGGDSWRPLARTPGARLAWPAPEALYRAEGAGAISVSPDGGDTWRPVGQVEGEPARLKAVDAQHLYVVLKTGAILESRDGARTWKPVYEP